MRSVVTALLVFGALVAPLHPAAAAPIIREPFEDAAWHEDEWIDVRASDVANSSLVQGFIGSGLGVTVPAGTRRGVGPLKRPDPTPDEAWFRYHLRLRSWDAVDSGKLPGLSGVYSFTAKGCLPSVPGAPGWSARVLFEATGTEGAGPGQVRLGYYVYHLDQPGICGEQLHWDPGVIDIGRWYCVQGHVKLNTPGESDGVLEAWLDGTRVFRRTGMAFRRASETEVGIREFWLNVFFGGTSSTPNDLNLTVDQVVVSTERRVGCAEPFIDDNGSAHEGAIEELHARGLLFGCGFQLYCPAQTLTRAEVAALLSRVLRLPAATTDPFDDDEGHWGEDVINRLAAAGIARGCNPPANDRFCPDAPVSRAELAAMMTRAYRLPAGEIDAFNDDDGHWAEADINALAAAGITRGCGDGEFCPDVSLPRDQAATLFLRAADRAAAT